MEDELTFPWSYQCSQLFVASDHSQTWKHLKHHLAPDFLGQLQIKFEVYYSHEKKTLLWKPHSILLTHKIVKILTHWRWSWFVRIGRWTTTIFKCITLRSNFCGLHRLLHKVTPKIKGWSFIIDRQINCSNKSYIKHTKSWVWLFKMT